MLGHPKERRLSVGGRKVKLNDDIRYATKPSSKGNKWTPEEDQRLLEAVAIYGDHNWVSVAKCKCFRDY